MNLPEIAKWVGAAAFLAACIAAVWQTAHGVPERRPGITPNVREIASVFILMLLLRMLLLVATLLLYGKLNPGSGFGLTEALNRWDAPHYMWIAENGYQAVTPDSDGHLFIVFFPLYPLLVRIFGGSATAGIFLNCVLSAAAAVVLYVWSRRQGQNESASLMSGLFFLLFPLSVFQMAPYTESLFVLLTVSALFALSEKRYALTAILGFFAALTRNAGAFILLPAGVSLLYDWKQSQKLPLRNALWMLLIPMGTLIYLGINQVVYGDPLKFMEIQREHWYQGLGFFGDTIACVTRNFMEYGDSSRWYLWGSEGIAIAATLVSLPFLLSQMRPEEKAYTLVYVLFILSPTWLLSYPRYLMGLAPLYPALSRLFFGRGKARAVCGTVLLMLFTAAMFVMTYGFLTGQQVL